jgi:hypothetical protein
MNILHEISDNVFTSKYNIMSTLVIKYEKTSTELKKEVFEAYKNNEFIKQAINKDKSICESIDDLLELENGQRKFIPQKLNEEHNAKVKEMEKLIPELTHLYTKGRLSATTLFMKTIYGGLALSPIIGGVFLGIINTVGHGETDEYSYCLRNEIYVQTFFSALVLGGIIGFSKGILDKKYYQYKNKKIKEKAKCVDNIIKDNYN